MHSWSKHKHFNIIKYTKGDVRGKKKKKSSLIINGACQFFGAGKKQKRIKIMEIPGDQNKATTVCTKRTSCAVDY